MDRKSGETLFKLAFQLLGFAIQLSKNSEVTIKLTKLASQDYELLLKDIVEQKHDQSILYTFRASMLLHRQRWFQGCPRSLDSSDRVQGHRQPRHPCYNHLALVEVDVVNDAFLTLKAFRLGMSLIVLRKCHMKGSI